MDGYRRNKSNGYNYILYIHTHGKLIRITSQGRKGSTKTSSLIGDYPLLGVSVT